MIRCRDSRKLMGLFLPALALVALAALTQGRQVESAKNGGRRNATGSAPTFYRDVLPILQERCQICHRAGGIAPARFERYEQTRPFAGVIAAATQNKSMPPWFADARIGHFSNDPSLSAGQIAALAAWAGAGAPAGDAHDAPPPPRWAESWSIPQPDLILKMPKGVALPASGDVEYTYEIVAPGSVLPIISATRP